MKIGERLAHLMLFRGISSSELATKVGATRQSVAYWKSGRNRPNEEFARRLGEALNCSPAWLMTGAGVAPDGFKDIQTFTTEDSPPAGFVAIKEYRLTFAAGYGCEPSWEEIHESEPVMYRESFFQKRQIRPERCRRAKVSGDSMLPLIDSGDTILFYAELDPNPHFVQIHDGAVYCVAVDGNLKIKRLSTFAFTVESLKLSINFDFHEEIIYVCQAGRFY